MSAAPGTPQSGGDGKSPRGRHRRFDAEFPAGAIVALLITIAAVVLSPSRSNFFWATSGLHGTSAPTWGALVLGALALAGWALGAPLPYATITMLGLLVLVGPWREAGHLLGDTFVRQRALELARQGGAVASFAEFGRLMHAQPLDDVLGVWGPALLARRGVSPTVTLSVVGATLALAWFTIAHLTVRRLLPSAPSALAVALVMGGALEVFAGYAESGSVILVFGGLWWWSLTATMHSRRRALLAVVAWLAFAAAHRVALVALVPQLLRAYSIRLEGDDDRARRWLGFGTLGALFAGALASGEAVRGVLAQDFGELFATASRFTPLHDVVNLTVVVMPLALLAPLVLGAAPLRAELASPSGRLHLAAWLPLLPLVLVFPMAPHGLGPHRDWELAILPGWIATTFMAGALARMKPVRLRGALALLLPAQLLLAAAWIAPNADPGSTRLRAITLVNAAGGVRGEARAHACTYLGYRSADAGDDRASAKWFDQSYAAFANPRTALLASESWLRAGDLDAAGRSLARARSGGPLPAELERVEHQLRRAIELESTAGLGGSKR